MSTVRFKSEAEFRKFVDKQARNLGTSIAKVELPKASPTTPTVPFSEAFVPTRQVKPMTMPRRGRSRRQSSGAVLGAMLKSVIGLCLVVNAVLVAFWILGIILIEIDVHRGRLAELSNAGKAWFLEQKHVR